jgi:hypothetical protein
VFPLYHILADVAGWRGAEVLDCRSTRPLDVVGFAVQGDGVTHVLVANLTPNCQETTVSGLEGTAIVRRLNGESAQRALFQAQRFRAGAEGIPNAKGLSLKLAPYETVRIDA